MRGLQSSFSCPCLRMHSCFRLCQALHTTKNTINALPCCAHTWPSEMPQRRHRGQRTRVYQVPAVIKDVYIAAQLPHLPRTWAVRGSASSWKSERSLCVHVSRNCDWPTLLLSRYHPCKQLRLASETRHPSPSRPTIVGVLRSMVDDYGMRVYHEGTLHPPIVSLDDFQAQESFSDCHIQYGDTVSARYSSLSVFFCLRAVSLSKRVTYNRHTRRPTPEQNKNSQRVRRDYVQKYEGRAHREQLRVSRVYRSCGTSTECAIQQSALQARAGATQKRTKNDPMRP